MRKLMTTAILVSMVTLGACGSKIDHSPDHGLAQEKELASKIVSRL